MKILLIEDDPDTCDLLAAQLGAAHYDVTAVQRGEVGVQEALTWAYSLIILDLHLPDFSGLEVCRRLRHEGMATPIVLLTAEGSRADEIMALDVGADDFITKPFDLGQLLARIRALLRRQQVTNPEVFRWGDLVLDPASVRLTYQGQEVALTPKEFALLELFLRYPQQVFSRQAIMENLWSPEDAPTEGAVTNLVKDLRQRLKAAAVQGDLISTIYGMGYRLKEPPLPTPPEPPPTALDAPPPAASVAPSQLFSMEQIALRFRTSLQQRLDVLETVIYQPGGKLSALQRQRAQEEAHRLVEGLITFGYNEAAERAKALEARLAEAKDRTAEGRDRLCQALLTLKEAVAQAALVAPPPAPKAHLLVVSADAHASAPWRAVAAERGWQLTRVAPMEALEGLQQLAVQAVVVVLADAADSAALTLIETLHRQQSTLPLVVLAAEDSLPERVQMARLGVSQYLVHPVAAEELFAGLDALTMSAAPEAGRVLVVDNDGLNRNLVRQLLVPWGIQVTEAAGPEEFWTLLHQVRPDVLLLDLDLPTFNGIELCQVVRQDPQVQDLCILVMGDWGIGDQGEATWGQQAYAAGADGLISKTLQGPSLVSQVLAHIERQRQRQPLDLRRTMANGPLGQVDALTQVFSRQYLETFLHRQWRQHQQTHSPLSFILCAVDCFAAYSSHYGQGAGHQVLQRVAQCLEGAVNPNTDLVARYGEERFAVVLPHTFLDGALQVATRIRHAVSELHIPHSRSTCGDTLTLSLGVAGTVPDAHRATQDLILTADQALQTAQTRGRNTYCLFPL